MSLSDDVVQDLCVARVRGPTAELSRRRIAPRATVGEARPPHRYTVGRTRLTERILHGESTLLTGASESRRGRRSASAIGWAALLKREALALARRPAGLVLCSCSALFREWLYGRD